MFKAENKKSCVEVLFQPHTSNQKAHFEHVDSGFSEDQSTETCGSATTETPNYEAEEFPVDCDSATILSSALVEDKDQLMEVMVGRCSAESKRTLTYEKHF